MKLSNLFIITLLFLSTYSSFAQSAANNNQHDLASNKTPVDYVYPYIGSINPKTRSTTPVIKVPGGNI